jgi:hypothetical protein
MLLRLCLALGLAASPAAAFTERHGHWTVTDAGGTCMAVNRPLEEFNAQPYAALAFVKRGGDAPRLQLYAWPGAFTPGARLMVEVAIGGAEPLGAEALDSYLVEVREPLPAELVADMRGFVGFGVEGLPQGLMFDLSQIDALLRSLEACARRRAR